MSNSEAAKARRARLAATLRIAETHPVPSNPAEPKGRPERRTIVRNKREKPVLAPATAAHYVLYGLRARGEI